jgi:hypothetical protein
VSPVISAKGGLSSAGYGQFALSVAGGSYESIATVTVSGGSTTTISFSSIPSTYKHLQIRGLLRHDYTGASGDYSVVRFNGDTGNNYSGHRLEGTGSSASATAWSSVVGMYMGGIATNDLTSGIFGVAVIDILDYADTSKNKTLRSLTGWDANGSGNVQLFSGARYNTAAITSISLIPGSGTNWIAGSTLSLYGIKGA